MTKTWFQKVQDEFRQSLAPYRDKPINYVEVGCWRGESAEWVCENVLTHKDAAGFGIDPYDYDNKRTQEQLDRVKATARSRLLRFNRTAKWRWYYQPSITALRNWTRPIDVLYLDGRHEAPMVMQDFVLALPWLRRKGLIVFDDFKVGLRKQFPHVPEAVAAILTAFDGFVEPIGQGDRQYTLRVMNTVCDQRWFKLVKNASHDFNQAPELINKKETEFANREQFRKRLLRAQRRNLS